jgi:hypothetical protein
MFEKRVLRWIFGLRGVHNVDLHDLYSSPYIVGMITSRRKRCVGHVA